MDTSIKILVTGSAGFMGSLIADALIKAGYTEVYGVDDLSGGSLENVSAEAKSKFFIADLSKTIDAERVVYGIKPDVIFHLAANAREGASFFQPLSIVHRNYLAYINVLEPAIKHGLDKIILFSCHDSKTRLVTTEGIKEYKDIKKTDKVYTLNPLTANVEIKSINEIIINKYKGRMLKFSGRASLCVTPNHRMFFVKSISINPRLDFELAEETFKRNYFKLPVAKWVGVNYAHRYALAENLWRRKQQPTEILTEDLFYLIGLFIADGVTQEYSSTRESKSGLDFKTFISIRDTKGRFVGMKLDKDIKQSTGTVKRIRFCVPRTDKARQKLEYILIRNNFSYNESDNEIDLVSYGLFEIFKQCGGSAHEKHIPKQLLLAEKSLLVKLFEGIMDGDGNKEHTILTTTSDYLVRDMIELGVKIGKTVSFTRYDNHSAFIKGREVICKKCYQVIIGHTEPNLHNRESKEIYYEGDVWCLNVDNGNFLIEREGSTCFSGNSMAVYGDQPYPFSENQERKPVDVYGLNKAAMEHTTEMLSKVHDFRYTIIRPHNVFGPRQSLRDPYRNVIAIFMNRIMRGEPLYIYGDGEQKRAFSYIEDSLPCYLNCLNDRVDGEIINIGGMHPISINILRRRVCVAMEVDPDNYPTRHIMERPHEVKFAWCTSKKSEKLLGYEEKLGMVDGIKSMAEWAKQKGPQEWSDEKLALWNEKAPSIWK